MTAVVLFCEVIAWKLRAFIPTSDEGPVILSRLLEPHRIVAVAGRA